MRLQAGALVYQEFVFQDFVDSLEEAPARFMKALNGVIEWTAKKAGEIVVVTAKGLSSGLWGLLKTPGGIFGAIALIFFGRIFYKWKKDEQKLSYSRPAPLDKESKELKKAEQSARIAEMISRTAARSKGTKDIDK
jgi:hypothetical protein